MVFCIWTLIWGSAGIICAHNIHNQKMSPSIFSTLKKPEISTDAYHYSQQKPEPRIDSHCPNGHQTSTVKTGVSPPLDVEELLIKTGGAIFWQKHIKHWCHKKHLVWQQKSLNRTSLLNLS